MLQVLLLAGGHVTSYLKSFLRMPYVLTGFAIPLVTTLIFHVKMLRSITLPYYSIYILIAISWIVTCLGIRFNLIAAWKAKIVIVVFLFVIVMEVLLLGIVMFSIDGMAGVFSNSD